MAQNTITGSISINTNNELGYDGDMIASSIISHLGFLSGKVAVEQYGYESIISVLETETYLDAEDIREALVGLKLELDENAIDYYSFEFDYVPARHVITFVAEDDGITTK